MKNKTRLTFISVALAALMILGACNSSGSGSSSNSQNSSDITSTSSSESESSSSSTSSSLAPAVKHNVEFKSEGQLLETVKVADGELAEYGGEIPLKESNSVTNKYRFDGWEEDITQPITKDTVFNAKFKEVTYTPEVVIDDFESYYESEELEDEGWEALVYSGDNWIPSSNAVVSLSSNAADGNQALRFDARSNGLGFMAVKTFDAGTYNQKVNAVNFKCMVPTCMTIRVLLELKVKIENEWKTPSFRFEIGKPATGKYVEYTIPLADPDWVLWSKKGDSIKSMAGWVGVHQDDILKYLTKIEFYIAGEDGKNGQKCIAFLDSFRFISTETCEATRESIESPISLYKTYTGKLSNDHILRIDVDSNNNATASIIDLETPQSFNGSLVVDGKNVTFTSRDNGQSLIYKGVLTAGGQIIEFTSATGAYADDVADMNLNAVSSVDNYEQYEVGGTAYCENNTDKAKRTGVYQGYYGEYYAASGKSEFGQSGWKILDGDGEKLQLVSDQAIAHSGNKCLKLTNNNNNAYRYIQWGLVDGTADKNYYRGSTLSFWAKTQGYVPVFKVSCYWQTNPNNTTKDNQVFTGVFANRNELTEWTHFEVQLDPDYVYYGFLVFMEKKNNGSNDTYLLIDDVEIYGANPYAVYKEPEPEKGPEPIPGLNYFASVGGLVNVQLNIKDNNAAELKSTGLNMTVNGTYAVQDDKVTFTFDGGITYVTTISEDSKTLTYSSVTGEGAVANALRNLSFNMINYADNAETYEDDGVMYYQSNRVESNAYGARGAYFCEYAYSGSSTPVSGSGWILMGGSGDQLQLDKNDSYEGKQSLKIKKSTAGDMRYMQWELYKGTAEPKTGVDRFSVAIKNTNSNTAMKIMVYKVQQVTKDTNVDENIVTESITIPANQGWKVYTVKLDPNETYYGYCLYMNQAASGQTSYINVDNAVFFNSANNPAMPFSSPKDLVLSNNTDSLKFNGNDDALVTCSAMSLANFACKYDMELVEGKQMMTVTVGGKELIGEYAVNMEGRATFKVTDGDADLLQVYPVNTIFANK